jgi:hypothetical protein
MGRVEKEFLDPEQLLTDEVADWLCGCGKYSGRLKIDPSGVKSLAHVMAVVTTLQSARSLRYALAHRMAGRPALQKRRIRH